MKFAFGLAVLASLAAGAPSNLALRAPTSLEVKIEMAGNSLVKATFTNNGQDNLRLLKTATILDSIPVKKADVLSGDEPLEFGGIYARVEPQHLDETSFEDLASGSTLETSFDLAEVYDLSKGGRFTVRSQGALSFAKEATLDLIGAVGYSSNTLEADIDGAEASKTQSVSSLHEKRGPVKRTVIQGDCDVDDRRSVILGGLYMCTIYASGASNTTFAREKEDKLIEYFKRSDSLTVFKVGGGLSLIADVCKKADSGDTKIFCSDRYNFCRPGVPAYTVPNESSMVYCDSFFDNPSSEPGNCHQGDLGTTILHEASHLKETIATSDYGTYGYEGLRGLTADQNINHADTYTYYAQALILGC